MRPHMTDQFQYITLTDDKGGENIVLDGNHGNFSAGGTGHNGDLRVKNADGETVVTISGNDGDIVPNGVSFKTLVEAIASL